MPRTNIIDFIILLHVILIIYIFIKINEILEDISGT
jgi:hypothetical protein